MRVQEELNPESVDHRHHHGDFVVSSELLTVLRSGEPLAGELIAHSLTARDEEVMGGMLGVGGCDRDGQPISHVLRARKFLFKNTAQHQLPGHLGLHDALGQLGVVGVPLRQGGEEKIILGGEVTKQGRVGDVGP